jgi:hypothetical protein
LSHINSGEQLYISLIVSINESVGGKLDPNVGLDYLFSGSVLETIVGCKLRGRKHPLSAVYPYASDPETFDNTACRSQQTIGLCCQCRLLFPLQIPSKDSQEVIH